MKQALRDAKHQVTVNKHLDVRAEMQKAKCWSWKAAASLVGYGWSRGCCPIHLCLAMVLQEQRAEVSFVSLSDVGV